MPRLKEIAQYQLAHPPLHVLVHAYLGGAKGSTAATAGTAEGPRPWDEPQEPTKVSESFLASMAALGVDMSALNA